MKYSENIAGPETVTITMTAQEAQRLEDFIHLSAMALMSWPVVAGDYMTERKRRRTVPEEVHVEIVPDLGKYGRQV